MTDDSKEPVVLVNIFHVTPEQGDELMAVWSDILRSFRSTPGFISAQFHRSNAGSGTFLNYSVWESVAHYQTAFANPEFRKKLPAYPDGTVDSPHLFHKVAIQNVCVA